jgi:hypothetical protein
VVLAGAAAGAVALYFSAAGGQDGPTSIPTCSWPLHVRGTASSQQAGLVRCYMRALARRDLDGLKAVADNNPPARITRTQLTHSADARSGTATVTFVPNLSDDAYETVHIAFADGARQNVPMLIANPQSVSSWRLQIGDNS